MDSIPDLLKERAAIRQEERRVGGGYRNLIRRRDFNARLRRVRQHFPVQGGALAGGGLTNTQWFNQYTRNFSENPLFKKKGGLIAQSSLQERDFKKKKLFKPSIQQLHPGESTTFVEPSTAFAAFNTLVARGLNEPQRRLVQLYLIYYLAASYMRGGDELGSVTEESADIKTFHSKIQKLWDEAHRDHQAIRQAFASMKAAADPERVHFIHRNLVTMLQLGGIDFACLQECTPSLSAYLEEHAPTYDVQVMKTGTRWRCDPPSLRSRLPKHHQSLFSESSTESTQASTGNNPPIAIVYNKRKYEFVKIRLYVPHHYTPATVTPNGKKQEENNESILICEFTKLDDRQNIIIGSAHLKSTGYGETGEDYRNAHVILREFGCHYVGMDCNNKGQWTQATANTQTLGRNKEAKLGLHALCGTTFQTSAPYGATTQKQRTFFQTQVWKTSLDSACKDLVLVRNSSGDGGLPESYTHPQLNEATMMTPLITDRMRWDSDHCAVIFNPTRAVKSWSDYATSTHEHAEQPEQPEQDTGEHPRILTWNMAGEADNWLEFNVSPEAGDLNKFLAQCIQECLAEPAPGSAYCRGLISWTVGRILLRCCFR